MNIQATAKAAIRISVCLCLWGQATARVGQAELFLVRLPSAPATAVRGGARLAGQSLVATLDGAGVLRFMPASLTPRVSEVDGKVRSTTQLKF